MLHIRRKMANHFRAALRQSSVAKGGTPPCFVAFVPEPKRGVVVPRCEVV